MKKGLKIFFIVLGIIIVLILLDSIQALLFNNNPIIGIETKCMKKEGLIVETYHCENKNITKIKSFDNSCNSEIVCVEIIERKIKENLKRIHEINNGISSNPYDYINNDYYKNIVNLGSDGVRAIIKMYENEELSGLDAYIGGIAIEEITGCNIKEKYHINWSNSNEFYKSWKDYHCNFNIEDTKNYIIIDKSEEIDDFTCASALEPFYEDDNYRYSYSCIKSKYVIVKYSDGSEETLKEALKNKKVKIEDLDLFHISYYKDKK